MKRSEEVRVSPNGTKTTWYFVENEHGQRAESQTKNYERLERELNEQTK